MAITIAPTVRSELVKPAFGFVVIYEIELANAAGTLRLAPSAVTWGGNVYTPLAVKETALTEDMRLTTQELRVTFSNVTNVLRSHLVPVDNLTDAKITQRLIVRSNVVGNFKAESHIKFVGRVQKPTRATETIFELVALSIINSESAAIPAMKTATFCQARFADGRNCNYVGGLTTCERNQTDCDERARFHEFLGVLPGAGPYGFNRTRTTTPINEIVDSGNNADSTRPPNFEPGTFFSMRPRFNVREANAKTPVPLVFGRKTLAGVEVERALGKFVGETINSRGDIIIVSWGGPGGIENVHRYITDGGEGPVESFPSGKFSTGFYWRRGDIGIDADEVTAGVALLPQNRSPFSLVGQTYSRRAYVTFVQSLADDIEIIRNPLFDVSGIRLFTWAAGVKSGSPVWTPNPVWATVFMLTDKDVGMGFDIAEDDMDHITNEATADVCDVVKDGVIANTVLVGTKSPTNELTVKSTYGFARGMTVRTSGVDRVILDITTETDMLIDGAAVGHADGATLVGRIPTWAAHCVIMDSQNPVKRVQEMLQTFRGFITYDQGKIQIKTEDVQAVISKHYKLVEPTNPEFRIASKPEFKWLIRDTRRNKNQVVVSFDNDSLDVGADQHTETAWSVVEDTRQLRPVSISAACVGTADHAAQLAATELAKLTTQGQGGTFRVGPIGIEDQPGDVILVSHDVPSWASNEKRIIRKVTRGLGEEDELFVDLTVEHYDGPSYTAIPSRHKPNHLEVAVSITLTVEAESTGRAVLTWDTDGTFGRFDAFEIHKSSTAAFTASRANRVATVEPVITRWIYQPTDAEIAADAPIYFKVSSVRRRFYRNTSNEVAVIPGDFDPSSTGDSSPFNMLLGGDFNDESDWKTVGAGEVRVAASGDGPPIPSEATVQATNPANAWDGDPDTTYSNGSGYGSGTVTPGDRFTFGTGVENGRLRVRIYVADYIGTARAKYSTDGGSNWIQMSSVGGRQQGQQSIDVYSDALIGVDRSQLLLDVWGYSRLATPGTEFRWYDAAWIQEPPTGAFSSVGGGVGSLQGNGGVDFADIYRGFPGRAPDPSETVFQADQIATIQISVFNPTTPTGDLRLFLRDTDTGFEWTMMTVAVADMVVGAWKHFDVQFKPTTDVFGRLEAVARTNSTALMNIDQWSIRRGVQLAPFSASPEEMVTTKKGSYFGNAIRRPVLTRGRRTPGVVVRSNMLGLQT